MTLIHTCGIDGQPIFDLLRGTGAHWVHIRDIIGRVGRERQCDRSVQPRRGQRLCPYRYLQDTYHVISQIGSVSTTGAQSSLVPNFLSRLSPTPAAHASTVARSFLISADMGHAVHPNYTSKYEENHRPAINGGVVLKINANQRYVVQPKASDTVY